jgi:phenylacetate-CoA ligase
MVRRELVPDDRAELQDRRLRALLARLRDVRTPFWEEKLAGVDPGLGIDGIDRLPFTTKAELRDTYPFGALAVPLEQTIRIQASSGTRGKPTIVAYTRADVELFAEVNARAIACAGGSAGDVLHVAYGYGLFTGGLGLHYGGERLGATVVPASGGNSGFQVQLLADLGATGVACTPSFALLLAERAAADGLLDPIRLRFGLHGAEPWSEALREAIEAAWGGGYDAIDLYGLSEVIGPGVACECREGKGALHVFDDHFFPEIVDPETGSPVARGERGELVLTTLTKEALPVIRYRTGDVTRFVDEPCGCGRTHPRIARFSGRVDDMLVIRGVNVFPSEIEAVLLAHPATGSQYQIVVDRSGPLQEIEIRCELAEALSAERVGEIEAELVDAFGRRLVPRARLVLSEPGSLPRPEIGKAQRVIQRP